MEHPDHPDEGYAGYMMTKVASELYSTTRWKDPADLGNYFIDPTTNITNTDQRPEERKRQQVRNYWTLTATCAPPSKNYLREPLIYNTIDTEYHSRGMTNTGMERMGFGIN